MAENEGNPIDADYKVSFGANGEANVEPKVEPAGEGEGEGLEVKEGAKPTEGEGKEPKDGEGGEPAPAEGEGEGEGNNPEPKPEKTKEELFNELISDKYNMTAEELETVLTKKEEAPELPEDVQKYLDFKKETGRGLDDYIKLQQDFSTLSDEVLIREYYKATRQGLDDSDIESLIDVKFGYEENASEVEIKQKKLELKEELYKAKSHFETQKEKYAVPLESSAKLSEEQTKAVEFYQQYLVEQQAQDKRQKETRRVFEEKTSKLFNDDFKGFEFNVGEEKLVFKPKDVNEVRSSQSDLSNFISKHTDQDGNLIDAKSYHTALSMALNPEAYAKFFYEQGRASAVKNVIADGKNIDMGVRSSVDDRTPKPGIRVLDDGSSSSGLKIKRR